MFLDWKNRYCENNYTTESNLQIQCNSYQTINGILHRTRTKKFTICMETQNTPNSQSNHEQEKRSLSPPAPFSFLKIALAIRGVLCFHTNCETFCSSSVKNAIGSLIGIALNLYLALESMYMLTILCLLICEHGISVYWCVLQFLSLQFCSFQYTGLSPPWLSLFLGILLFLTNK